MSGRHYELDLVFERADGSRIEGNFTRRRVVSRPASIHRVLPSGYGYLRLTQWTVGVMPGVLEGIEALKDAPGIVIDVPSIDAALEAVNRAGGETVRERDKVGDMGFAAYFRDSEGNLVGLWETAAPS